MQRVILGICLGLLIPTIGHAEMNPLKVLLDQLLRPDIMFVLDTSGSMSWSISGSSNGSDCGAHRTNMDLRGDGICMGGETISNSPLDCHLTSPTSSSNAGNGEVCYRNSVSRMYIAKRVMRTIVPQLRTAANFGLASYSQSNYFRYFRGDPSRTRRNVSIFLSQQEMIARGAWDSTNMRPSLNFTWNGTTFTLLSAAGLTVTADSLYSRTDNSSFEDRFTYATSGMQTSSGGFTWNYMGSYFTYNQMGINTGSYKHDSFYRGPQYFDGTNTWVYNRFAKSSTPISGGGSGRMLTPVTASEVQSDQDAAVRQLMGHLNLASNGGLVGSGGTPTGPGIGVAHQSFIHKAQGKCTDDSVKSFGTYRMPSLASFYPGGVCPYTGPDPIAKCRPRFVISLSDGDYNSGIGADIAARNLYNDSNFHGNPVKTLVIGLPGLPSNYRQKLNRVADYGADGKLDNDASCCCATSACEDLCTNGETCDLAYFANNESELIDAIWKALFDAILGDYTTSQAGIATSGTSYLPGDIALISSTEFPGWNGHMRAWNLIQDPPVELWDAGENLSSAKRDYKSRMLYTGYPTSMSGGAPVALFSDSAGTVDTSAILSVWKSIYPTPSVIPTTAEVISMVEWLAGKTRDWRMDPIISSTPANVGPVPNYDVGNHADFEAKHVNRERLIYVASNDGLLHAIRAVDGTEAFAYLPPNLLPKVYNLWKMGGQPMDPKEFEWLLASSPRVEDMPPSGTKGWRTQLVLTMGKGDRAVVALDISNPSDCNSYPCSLNLPPFKIDGFHNESSMSNMGETWSIPALFYDGLGKSVMGRAAMGSGYTTGLPGDYYHYFDTLWGTSADAIHASSGAKVDYGVVAFTAAAIDVSNSRNVVATYQADLNGRIIRYDKGLPASTTIVARDMVSGYSAISNPSSPTTPFYHGPAVLYRENGKVTLAAVSGSYDEEDPPDPMDPTTLFMRTETLATLSPADSFTCSVTKLCSVGSCFSSVPAGCTAPKAATMPVSAPMLMENTVTSEIEAWYLLYELPPNKCTLGTTWLVRTSTVTGSGTKPMLVSSQSFPGMHATGVALAGGGRAIFITQSGTMGKKASVTKTSGSMGNPGSLSNAPMIESWVEVK